LDIHDTKFSKFPDLVAKYNFGTFSCQIFNRSAAVVKDKHLLLWEGANFVNSAMSNLEQ
jgi:hypothetical protein